MDPTPAEVSGTEQPTPQQVLARKLQLLLDACIADKGRLVTFRDIADAMAARGVKLSRARWFYMKDATGPVVRNPRLLTALADFFNVSPTYLLGVEGTETPALITDRIDFIRALRTSRVQIFAAKELGELMPDTFHAISKILEPDMAPSPLGTAAGRLSPKQHLHAPFPGGE